MARTRAVALAALCAFAAACVQAVDEVRNAESAAKAQELTELSNGGLAPLTDANFDRLVRSANRDFHTFVLFNARDDKFQCALCGPFEDEVAVLASSYWRARARDTQGNVPRMFFARAEYTPNRQIFGQYNLQSVPMLVHFAPTGPVPHPKNKFPLNAQYASEMDAENAALFVREKTDFKVEVYRSPWAAIAVLVLLLGAIGGSLYVLRSRIPVFIAWLQNSTFIWLIAGVSLYYIAVSGFLYDIIRGVPPFGYDSKTRRLIIFAQQSGTQYGIEGAIIGMMNIGAALAIILLVRVFPKIRDSGYKMLWSMAAVATFLFFFSQIIGLYRFKNPWYNPFRMSTSGM